MCLDPYTFTFWVPNLCIEDTLHEAQYSKQGRGRLYRSGQQPNPLIPTGSFHLIFNFLVHLTFHDYGSPRPYNL